MTGEASRSSPLRTLGLVAGGLLLAYVGFQLGLVLTSRFAPPPPAEPPVREPVPTPTPPVTEPPPGPAGLPAGPVWSRSPFFLPEGANVLFATSDGCALCHSLAPNALAMKGEDGADLSAHGTWAGTMMANAYVDPYWRAAVAQAVAAAPESQAELEALCLRCHGPMASHTARIAGWESPPLAEAELDPLAYDGVSCTVCHQVRPDRLGEPESFDGRLDIRPGRRIFGPFEKPIAMPMVNVTLFKPEHGSHISKSALCGSCHTLETEPAPGAHFLEQSPYLEWRNSVFSDERGTTEASRSCVDCHMALLEDTAIARAPNGRDFSILARSPVRSHTMVGGNAFMLRMLRENRDELGVTASAESLETVENATREFLRNETASLALLAVKRTAGGVQFDVRVENNTGHKLPSAYPSRRAWLRTRVLAGERVLFESGAFDERGRVAGAEGPASMPHRDVIDSPGQVVFYEAIPADANGNPTTVLPAMARLLKDSRLLPRGWRPSGPHGAETLPIGVVSFGADGPGGVPRVIEGDENFVAGADRVTYRVALPPATSGALTIEVTLLYQTIPPRWVDPLRSVDDEHARRFVRMYDAADPRPEVLAETTQTID